MIRQPIEKFLEQNRLIVADIVDPEKICVFDRDLDNPEQIRQGQQVNPGRPVPDGKQTPAQQPTRRFSQLYAAAINHPRAEYHRPHALIDTDAKEIFLGIEPGARMDGTRFDI
jgi:hypothetical protein